MSTNLQFQFSMISVAGKPSTAGVPYRNCILSIPETFTESISRSSGTFQLKGKNTGPLNIIIELRSDFEFRLHQKSSPSDAQKCVVPGAAHGSATDAEGLKKR